MKYEELQAMNKPTLIRLIRLKVRRVKPIEVRDKFISGLKNKKKATLIGYLSKRLKMPRKHRR